MKNLNFNLVVNHNVIIIMKNLSIFPSFIIILSLFGFSCEKDSLNDNLPSATTIGASTMGFLVDGKAWVAKSDDFKVSKTSAVLWPQFGLVIKAVNHPESRFSMTIANPKEGNYVFGDADEVRYERYDSSIVFSLDPIDTSSSLIFTRYDGGIVSGKFSFKLKSSNGAIISVTSGWFDIPIK